MIISAKSVIHLVYRVPALFLLLVFCTERFEPETGGIERLLVVDGLITDEKEAYFIKLSRSGVLGSSEKTPEAGALVSIVDSNGDSYTFTEGTAGIYQSDPQYFLAIAGNTYALDIITSEGSHYRSTAVLLKPAPDIDSVLYKREVRLTDEGDSLDGIRILVDSHDVEGTTRYYKYSWIESYEVRPRYPSYYDYDPESNPVFVLRDIRLNLCYATDTSRNILVTNTVQLEEDQVSGFELSYVSTEGYRLSSLYSILVKQYTISEQAYKYWSELEKLTESLGTVFDPYPYPVSGNITNVDDPNEVILGYFSASGVSDKRIYIKREDLGELNFPPDPCKEELRYPQNPQEFFLFLTWGYMIVDVTGGLWGPPECTDCRTHGVLEKPNFWPM